MQKPAFFKSLFLALAASALCSGAIAAPLYQSNFNSYTGSSAATQASTGLTVEAFGSVNGWTATGTNVIHAVQRSAGDWAVMLYDTNVVTMASGVAANAAGATYQVAFDGAGGNYNNIVQGTGANDTLLFEVLNSANAVVASYIYTPAAFSAANPFLAGGFSYVGNGSGAVRLRVSDTLQDNRFGGAFDNVSISAVPEPTSVLLMLAGVAGLAASRRKQRA